MDCKLKKKTNKNPKTRTKSNKKPTTIPKKPPQPLPPLPPIYFKISKHSLILACVRHAAPGELPP